MRRPGPWPQDFGIPRPDGGPGVVKVVVHRMFPPGAPALIHDQDRNHVQQRALTAAERHMMGDEVRAFFHAVWSAESTRWTLLERARDRDW